jgi:hypothetical protein
MGIEIDLIIFLERDEMLKRLFNNSRKHKMDYRKRGTDKTTKCTNKGYRKKVKSKKEF